MIITNVEIAKIIAEKGYDLQESLDAIDSGRTPEEEEEQISVEEVIDTIKSIILAFEIYKENRQ